jgi:hypothetical protein
MTQGEKPARAHHPTMVKVMSLMLADSAPARPPVAPDCLLIGASHWQHQTS